MSYNLPCPSLIGVLLVVSTHNGPQIVYHYPLELSKATLQSKGAEESDEDFDDEDYISEDAAQDESPTTWDSTHLDFYLGTKQDILSFLDDQNSRRNRMSELAATQSNSSGPDSPSSRAPLKQVASNLSRNSTVPLAKPPSNRILGFEPEHISEMLSPPRDMCNRRFEIMLENVVFLGLPVHVQSNGSWRPKKRSHREKSGQNDGTSSEKSGHTMSMFHLVFVMNPPEIERNYRTDEMFYYVVSKLSLVLRYEQLKSEYVWNQVKLISKLKEEWRTLSGQTSSGISGQSMMEYVCSKSSLCKAMSECYDAVSRSRIANLSINSKLRSFQIPIKLEFHSLPEITVPYIPGSYLSSAVNFLGNTGLVSIGETTRYRTGNLMHLLLGGQLEDLDAHNDEIDDDLDDEERTNTEDVLYLALLLLDTPDSIIRDIRAELHSELAKFIRMITPTDSLAKIIAKMNLLEKTVLTKDEVLLFALHLIYWRRARVISPLNSRSIYIVSPMAPITPNFNDDIGRFKRTFPTMPSLPLYLKLLSARSRKPRQFASIIPSRDHKDLYLEALAWLMRHGYVTQLHTYIWLKVSRKIKMKVEEDMEAELSKFKRSDYMLSKSNSKVDNNVDNKLETVAPNKPVDNSLKQVPEKKLTPASLDEDIDSIKKGLEGTSFIPNIVLEDDDATILVDPGRASSLERRWINKIVQEECALSPELTAIFYKVLKYMNGKNSLELLLLKENVSRSELRKLLAAVEEHIISVRHW